MNKGLSIIIPVYNSEKFIGRCLDSIYDQKLPLDLFEVIVINDGSKDKSSDIVESFRSRFSNLILINQENKGVATVRNIGIDKAIGEYIQFVDSDDFLEPGCLHYLLANLNRDISLIFYKYRLCYNDCTKDGDYNHSFDQYNIILTGDELIQKYGFHYSSWLCLYKRDFLLNIGVRFPIEIWGEDILFITEILLHCEKTIVLDIIVYNYAMYNLDSVTHKVNVEHQIKLAHSYCRVALKLYDLVNNPAFDISYPTSALIKQDANLYIILSIVKVIKYSLSYNLIDEIYHQINLRHILPIWSISRYANIFLKLIYLVFNVKIFVFLLYHIICIYKCLRIKFC